MLGPNGRGLADEAGLEDEVDFVVGTFSKSIGAIGGFGAGNHPLFDAVRYASRPYMFTASPVARQRLPPRGRRYASLPRSRSGATASLRNSSRLFERLPGLGLSLGCDVVSPVMAVKCVDEASTIDMWNALLEAGVYVNIGLPPGTPGKLCLLRCSVSAAHTDGDIDRIIGLFGEVVSAGQRGQSVAAQ